MDTKRNTQWPEWETVRLIGRGSFGSVYEIQRKVFDDTEKAALKVISIPQNDEDIDEMYNDGYDDASISTTLRDHLKSIVAEYSLMRKMNGCVNVVSCDDLRYVQHTDGLGWDVFIRMELLTPLTKALPVDISDETVVHIGVDICRALEECRKLDLIHRDIKPQNIFLSPRGDYKLGDFGIAKTVEKTMGGTKIGTYKYMAPEVYNNQPYGSAADIYSLGLVLYWMLNERRMPFMPLPPAMIRASDEENARARRFSGEAIPEPKNGSEKLKQIVLKACTYDPKERFASAEEMLAALNAIDAKAGAEPEHVLPMPEPEPAPPKSEPKTESPKLEPKQKLKSDPKIEPEPKPESKLEPKPEPTTMHMPQLRQRKKLIWMFCAGAVLLVGIVMFFCVHIWTEPTCEAPATCKICGKEDGEPWGHNWDTANERCIVCGASSMGDAQTEPEVPSGTISQNQTQLQEDQTEIVENVTLKVWAAQEDQVDDSSWLNQMQRAFEKAHPEYVFTWDNGVCTPGDASTLMAANPAYAADVFFYTSDGLHRLIANGCLAPLSGAQLSQVQNEFADTYQKSVTGSDGNLYGFPMSPNTWFMYYNKSILSENDVKSLEACLEKGTVAFDIRNSWNLPAFFFAAGGKLFGDSGTNASAGVTFGGEVGINVTSRLLELMEHPNFRLDGDGYGNAGMKSGAVAAYFSGSWDYAGLYDALGENLGAVPAPTVVIGGVTGQMKAYTNTYAVGVNPYSENQKAAMEFAAFLASAESQLLRFKMRGITPAVAALADHPDVAGSIVATAEFDTVAYASVAQPSIPEMDAVWGPIGSFGYALADGTINAGNMHEYVNDLDNRLNGR